MKYEFQSNEEVNKFIEGVLNNIDESTCQMLDLLIKHKIDMLDELSPEEIAKVAVEFNTTFRNNLSSYLVDFFSHL